MNRYLMYVIAGYLSGSVLYARVFLQLFGKADEYRKSKDENPGTANAFAYGGFACGVLTLTARTSPRLHWRWCCWLPCWVTPSPASMVCGAARGLR